MLPVQVQVDEAWFYDYISLFIIKLLTSQGNMCLHDDIASIILCLKACSGQRPGTINKPEAIFARSLLRG